MMHAAQMTFGGLVVAAFASFIASPILPDPKKITVHDLYLDGKIMIQDRTVRGNGVADTFYASWAAKFVDEATGKAAEFKGGDGATVVCAGSGSWPYRTGRIKIRLEFNEWVGVEACTYDALPTGCYVPEARWHWGWDEEIRRGKRFCK